jgi:hypothetical protein
MLFSFLAVLLANAVFRFNTPIDVHLDCRGNAGVERELQRNLAVNLASKKEGSMKQEKEEPKRKKGETERQAPGTQKTNPTKGQQAPSKNPPSRPLDIDDEDEEEETEQPRRA